MQDVLLAKKGRREHMEALMANGTVYMQRLAVYRDLESKVVGDPNDGLHARYPAENETVKIDIVLPDGKKMRMEGASLRLFSTARQHGVYCMYQIPVTPDVGVSIESVAPAMDDPRMKEFGDTIVIFKDSQEFVRRLEAAARGAGYELEHDDIEYVPLNYAGEMGPFRKLKDTHGYQREWRAITDKPLPGKDLFLHLGSLQDICLLIGP